MRLQNKSYYAAWSVTVVIGLLLFAACAGPPAYNPVTESRLEQLRGETVSWMRSLFNGQDVLHLKGNINVKLQAMKIEQCEKGEGNARMCSQARTLIENFNRMVSDYRDHQGEGWPDDFKQERLDNLAGWFNRLIATENEKLKPEGASL